MRLILVLALGLLLAARPACAGKYLSLAAGGWLPERTSGLNFGQGRTDVSYDTGWGVSGAFGGAFDSGLRLETELDYRQADARGASDNSWAAAWLLNLWWGMRNDSPLTPYLGGGAGLGRGHQASPGTVYFLGTGVAYQAGGGVDVRLNEALSLDVGYRYFGVIGIGDLSNYSLGTFDLSGSSVMAGVRFHFR